MKDKALSTDTVNKKNKSILLSNLYFLFIPFSLLFMDFVALISVTGFQPSKNYIYVFLLTGAIGCLFSALCGCLTGIARKIATYIILTFFAVFLAFQVGYYKNFAAYFCIDQMAIAGDAIADFSSLIIYAAKKIWYIILLMFIPLVIFIILRNKLAPPNTRGIIGCIASIIASIALFVGGISLISYTGDSYGADGFIYKYPLNEINISYETFGFINTSRLDIKQHIFGIPDVPLIINQGNTTDYSISPTDLEYGYNVSDINFNDLAEKEKDKKISQLHQFVNSQPATQKNEYTGLFKGKNLIMLTLEGFSGQIIDPELTPMLYKMSHNGFVFNNYYHSLWGGSTATGEYTNLTGNVYFSPTCLYRTDGTLQPLTMANSLKKQGYVCYGYHNHNYAYYCRHISHPIFGYNYKGLGSGVEVRETWPESDLEMAQLTVDEYINKEPFHAYYMTVSGHGQYDFTGNYMATIHRNEIPQKYQINEQLHAYYASQYDLELMLQYLVQRLDEAGILENTVFVMAPDHYPYPLNDESLSILYGLPEISIKSNFELYKNSFIIWSPSITKTVTVDKYCSAIDILPTLLNLWGIDYDSRLLIGSDVFSDSEGIAVVRLNHISWKTDQGLYDGKTSIFTPSRFCTMTESEQKAYVKQVTQTMNQKVNFSREVLNKDYYRYVFK